MKIALGVGRYAGAAFVEKDPASYTARERELFLETDTTLPLDQVGRIRSHKVA